MNIEWSKLYLLESCTPLMEQMEDFHDHAMMILILIFSFLSCIFLFLLKSVNVSMNFYGHESLEIFWTSIPMFVLFMLAFPSIQVLFMMEEMVSPMLTIKIIGSQWFWSYEYNDFLSIYFDSFMKDSDIFRLIEVDSPMIIPFLTQIRLLITSSDVIHSWTVPSLGVKVDANPGRLNSSWIYGFRSGYFYGQCSEICGVNHSFMPIKVEFSNLKEFKKWVYSWYKKKN